MKKLLLKAESVFLGATLFSLPWGTRYFFVAGYLAGRPYEYLSVFVSVLDLCALITVLLALFSGTWTKRDCQRPGRVLASILFITTLLLSLLSAREIWPAVAWLLRVFLAVALADLLRRRADRHFFASIFLASLLLSALWGIWQFASQNAPANKYLGLAVHPVAEAGTAVIEAGGRWLRAYGSTPHPNVFGGMMLMASILTSWLANRAVTLRQRLPWLVLSPIFIFALSLSFSRAAWLGAAIVFVLSLGFSFWGREGRVFWRRTAFVYLFVFVCFFLLFWPLVSSRLSADGRLEKRSLSERRESLTYFVDWSWTGWGFANYGSRAFASDPRSGFYYQPPHNFFSLAFVEVGVLSVPLLGWIIYELTLICRRKPLYLIFILPLIPLLLFDHWLWSLYFSPYLWAVYFSWLGTEE